MLRLLGSQRQMCGGVTRRDWMQVGGLGMLGVGLADVLRLQDQSLLADEQGAGFGKAKRCILLLPYGSPPQHETFDPKPDAPVEIRGTHGSIPTNLPGVRIDENEAGLMERSDEVLALRFVDPGLSADGAVDLCDNGGGNVDVGDAAVKDGGHEARKVTDHSAAQGHHEGSPVVMMLDQGPGKKLDLVHALGGLTGRDEVHTDFVAREFQGVLDAL